MDITLLSWVASALIFIGNIVLIRTKSWKTFLWFMVGNSIYVYYWLVKHEWATLLLVSLFLTQNIVGIIKWRKQEK